ncbi:MAG: redoxin domain-containing protein [bacterium]
MNISKISMVITTALMLGYVFTGCTPKQHSKEQRSNGIMQSFLAPYQGKVLLLLMGREGCPGTAKATAFLHTYASAKPEAVAILRLDVPLAGEVLELSEEWVHPYPRKVDTGRKIADALDFFFYPTFYVFDPDGEMRYSGGCDTAKLDSMVKEILAEKQGQPKRSYNLPIPKVGEPAPAFSGTDLNGQSLTLTRLQGKKATLLVFAQTSCPYTINALPAIQRVANAFREHDVTVVVINTREALETIQPVYDKSLSDIPVVWDKGGEISKQYGVDVSPFYFLLDQNNKVIKRGSFKAQTVTKVLNTLLDRSVDTPRPASKEAG